MARTLDADNQAAIAAEVTAPRFFVRMSFSTPVLLTDGVSVTWSAQGGDYLAADIDVLMGAQPVLSIFNDATTFGATVLQDGTAGRAVRIWKAYIDAGASSTLPGFAEPTLLFEGQMADAEIGTRVVIRCRQSAPSYTPRNYVSAPTFNFLPQRGTIIEMPKQKITLE